MKQDPFYRHHLRNHLNKYAEWMSDTTHNTMQGYRHLRLDERTKFDRLNLFDIRRTIPMREREPILDHEGWAKGTGKRKECKAVAKVRAGTGKFEVNGKPLHMYFHQAWMRNRIMTPLIITCYTAILDVKVDIKGGGTTG